MMFARRRDAAADRSRKIANEYDRLCLENFRLAMKRMGKPEEEIDRLCDELAERQQGGRYA